MSATPSPSRSSAQTLEQFADITGVGQHKLKRYGPRFTAEIAGTYVYGDYCSGDVWAVNADLPVFLVRTVQDLYAGFLALQLVTGVDLSFHHVWTLATAMAAAEATIPFEPMPASVSPRCSA